MLERLKNLVGKTEDSAPVQRPGADLQECLAALKDLEKDYLACSRRFFAVLKREAPNVGLLGMVPGLRKNSEKGQARLLGPMDVYARDLDRVAAEYKGVGDRINTVLQPPGDVTDVELRDRRAAIRSLRKDTEDGLKEIRVLRGALFSAGGSRAAVPEFAAACANVVTGLDDVAGAGGELARTCTEFLARSRGTD